MSAKVDIQNLTFGYSGQAPLLKDFDLEIAAGEAWSVIGPSGCGKTTLLYMIAGLRSPQSGAVLIDDHPIRRPRPKTGLILQDHGLLPWASVRENARLGFKIRRFYGPDGRHAPRQAICEPKHEDARVADWLQRLGIDRLQASYPSQLSRGQRQRTAIARSLVLGPDLLLLDEPFSALDAPTREDLQDIVLELNQQSGLTSILVTHDIDEAVLMGAKILAMGESATEVIVNTGFSGCRNGNEAQRSKMRSRLRSLLGRLR